MRSKLSVALMLVFITGCAKYSLDFVPNYEPGQDYSKYKTFNFYEQSGRSEVPINKEFDQRLRQAVEAGLIDAGYAKANSPDFYVSYWIDVTGAKNLDPYHQDSKQVVGNEKFDSGTLALDFIDATSQVRYWRGAVIGDIAERTPDDRLEEAVTRILQNYPPKD